MKRSKPYKRTSRTKCTAGSCILVSFIFFTADQQWKDTLASLLPGQICQDRSDNVAWVLHMKLHSVGDAYEEAHTRAVKRPYGG